MMDFLSNNSGLLLERSMGFLWTKQAAILDNITNAETPNYKPKIVTFEETLRDRLDAALGSVRPKHAVREVLQETDIAVTEAQESVRADENGVNVTEQNVELLRNSYQLQYVMGAISSELAVLRTAIRGQ